MGKESIVEIPPGSGNHYRYEYVDGKTLYKGPIGDAPTLTEKEFFDMSSNPIQVDEYTRKMSLTFLYGKSHDWSEIENVYEPYITDEIVERHIWWDLTSSNVVPGDWMVKIRDWSYSTGFPIGKPGIELEYRAKFDIYDENGLVVATGNMKGDGWASSPKEASEKKSSLEFLSYKIDPGSVIKE